MNLYSLAEGYASVRSITKSSWRKKIVTESIIKPRALIFRRVNPKHKRKRDTRTMNGDRTWKLFATDQWKRAAGRGSLNLVNVRNFLE